MTYADWVGSDRFERAFRMYNDAADHHVERVLTHTGIWIVRSQRRPGVRYRVDPKLRTCTCADFRKNSPTRQNFMCKHLILVTIVQRRGRLLRPRLGSEIHLSHEEGEFTNTMDPEEWRVVASASTVCVEDAFALLSEAASDSRSRIRGEWSVCVGDNGEITVSANGRTALFRTSPHIDMGKDAVSEVARFARAGIVQNASPDGAFVLELEVPVPRVHATDGMCIRELSPHHAFIADASTGEAVCGHVYEAERLRNWVQISEDLGPCPKCSEGADIGTQLLLIEARGAGAAKGTKRKASKSFNLQAWKKEARRARKEAGEDVAARNKAAVDAIEKLELATKPMMQLFLVGAPKKGTAGILDEAGKTAASDFLKSVDMWPGGWGAVPVVPYSILITATVFHIKLEPGVLEIFKDVSWHKGAKANQAKVKKRVAVDKAEAGEGKQEKPDPPVVVPEVVEEEFVAVLPTGPNTMKFKLNKAAPTHPELQFRVFGRDRCGDELVKELSIGKLSSYQELTQWAAVRLVDTAETSPQGLLLDHDTGEDFFSRTPFIFLRSLTFFFAQGRARRAPYGWRSVWRGASPK